MKIAVVGATGLVGTILLDELASGDFDIPIDEIVPIASESSAGNFIDFGGKMLEIIPLRKKNIPKVDIAFFAVGDELSKRFAPLFVESGATVIDKSNAFRRDKNVPLIVPEINFYAIGDAKIIASPNCSTIQLAMVLAPLKKFVIKSVYASTYQAISGAGKKAIIRFLEEWEDIWEYFENADITDIVGEHPYSHFEPPAIFANIVPQIGKILDDGSFTEEDKLRYETRKILDMPNLFIAATAVRVPVLNVHSEAVSVEFDAPVEIEELRNALDKMAGIVPSEDVITPADVSSSRKVFVSRLRTDAERKNIASMWIMADNLRKGAATNAIQIAETLVRRKIKP